jgi:hypothetical protein
MRGLALIVSLMMLSDANFNTHMSRPAVIGNLAGVLDQTC